MMNRIPERYIIAAIYVFFAAGALWNTLGVLQGFMQATTPFVLAGAAVVSVALTYRHRPSTYIAFAAIFIVTWAIEALGVATSFPFGTYVYTDQLGWKVLGVSIIIPFAWVLVIATSDAFVGHFFRRISAVLVALMATVFDFFLEFAADMLDLWHWSTRFPPLSNYISWFVISLAAVLLLRDMTERRDSLQTPGVPMSDAALRIPAHLWIAMVIYFCFTFLGMKSGLLTLS